MYFSKFLKDKTFADALKFINIKNIVCNKGIGIHIKIILNHPILKSHDKNIITTVNIVIKHHFFDILTPFSLVCLTFLTINIIPTIIPINKAIPAILPIIGIIEATDELVPISISILSLYVSTK